MTLNAVIALILRFFSQNSTDFQAEYITVVEDRPIISVKYCLPVLLLLAKTVTHPAARSLCDSWASCLHLYLLFFIPLYAEIRCLQHTVTYHGRVTVRLICFINDCTFTIHKIAGLPRILTNSVTRNLILFMNLFSLPITRHTIRLSTRATPATRSAPPNFRSAHMLCSHAYVRIFEVVKCGFWCG